MPGRYFYLARNPPLVSLGSPRSFALEQGTRTSLHWLELGKEQLADPLHPALELTPLSQKYYEFLPRSIAKLILTSMFKLYQ